MRRRASSNVLIGKHTTRTNRKAHSMECQYWRLHNSSQDCPNPPVARITVSGDLATMDVDVCEEHLNQLVEHFSTSESEQAQRQRRSW